MEILRSYQNLPLYIQTIFNLLLEIIRYRNYWSQISDRKNVDKHKNCKKKKHCKLSARVIIVSVIKLENKSNFFQRKTL